MEEERKMIEVINLGKRFDKKWVLNDLSLTINDGSIFGLVGINGAGKSTFLRLLSGVYKADGGSIDFDGKCVFDSTEVKKEIFFLPDDPFYSTNTKGNDLLELYRTMYTVDDVTFHKYMNLFNLNAKAPINNFSKGMRRQLFIALALSVKPKYLFLDEAFDGLDPLARLTFKRAIIELCEETNCTVIISSHSLRELEDICDSFGLLDHGHITSSGGISEEIEKVQISAGL
jgi:ABC-2 type transport system ATP-binding protein